MKYQFYDLFSPTYVTDNATPKSIYVLGWSCGYEANVIYAVHKHIKSRVELALLGETCKKIAELHSTDPDWPYLCGLLYVGSNPRVPVWDVVPHWIDEPDYLALMDKTVISSQTDVKGYRLIGQPYSMVRGTR